MNYTSTDHMTQLCQYQRQTLKSQQYSSGKRRTTASPSPQVLRHDVLDDHRNSQDQDFSSGQPQHDDVSEVNSNFPDPINRQDREKGWRILAAQTNTQLIHVLCDLVQAFIDTEKQIEVSLTKLGFSEDNSHNNTNSSSQADSEILSSLEDMIMDKSPVISNNTNHLSNGQSKVSWQLNNDNNNNNRTHHHQHKNHHHHPSNTTSGASVNTESVALTDGFCDDGPDLINPSSFILTSDSSAPHFLNPTLKIDDDIVLGYSKRLRTAVDRILHLLKNVASIQYDDPATAGQNVSCEHHQQQQQEQEQSSNRSGRGISKSASMPACCSTACDHKQEISALQTELKEATRMNRILQEEVNKKHNALSSLKARLETQSILDNEMLKEQNDDLASKLADAERKIQRQAEMINQLRTESTRARDDECVVAESSVTAVTETGRRQPHFSPAELPFPDNDSLPFDKSDELLNLDDLDCLSPHKWESPDHPNDGGDVIRYCRSDRSHHQSDHHASAALATVHTRVEDLDTRLSLHRASDSYVREKEHQYQKIIQEKDEEILVLKNQMKLAQDMISNSFSDQCLDRTDENIIESHIQSDLTTDRVNKKTSKKILSKAKKKRFTGVDLIEPIQDMRGSNESGSPKLSPSESVKSGNGPLTDVPLNQSSNSLDLSLQIHMMDAKISQLHSVIEKLITKNMQLQSEWDDYRSETTALQRDIKFYQKQEKLHHHMLREKERDIMRLKLTMEAKEQEVRRIKMDQTRDIEQEIDHLRKKILLQTEEASANEDRMKILSERIGCLGRTPAKSSYADGDETSELIFMQHKHGFKPKHRACLQRQMAELQSLSDKASGFI